MSTTPVSALRSPGVWVGFVGSVLVGWGSCNAEFSFDPRGWPLAWINSVGAVGASFYLDRFTIVAGVVALVWGWWHIRPTADRSPVHAATTLLLWTLPLL
ncbi:MAG: hypothetical protein KKB93_06840, partial [Actinobacteria bacterium]|nr:hypothetical protein [Actinomycetota bacterium]